MSSKNPYSEYMQDNSDSNGLNNETEVSPEMEEVDRGEADLKVEQGTKLTKNHYIAIGLIIFTLIVVGIFITALAKQFTGGKEVETEYEENRELSRIETDKLSNLQSRIEAEQRKADEAARLERERLAREARERARRSKPAPPLPVAPAAPAAAPVAKQPPPPPAPVAKEKPLHAKRPDELTPYELATLRKSQGDVLAYQGGTKGGSNKVDSGLSKPSSLGNMLITEQHAQGRAFLRTSRKFLLLRGTNIPCTIIPRVVTNYISQPVCVVNQDVYSPEGVVLIDRGSQVIGEQRQAVKNGKRRIFIAWSNIETPEGVNVSIDSMGADPLGGAGIDAWIDNHWKERFGNAILLSFMDDLFEIIAAEAGKNRYDFENSTDSASRMAEIALQHSINIEPTGYLLPARQTMIVVARDVDFSHIYETSRY